MATIKPVFNKTPVNVTFYRGETATLPCSVSNLGSSSVSIALKPFLVILKSSNLSLKFDRSYLPFLFCVIKSKLVKITTC